MYLAEIHPGVRVPVMTELPDRRRSSDQELGKIQGQVEFVVKLLDEGRDERKSNHQEVMTTIKTVPEDHRWIEDEGKPAVKRFNAAEQQMKGGLKVGRLAAFGGTAVVAGGAGAWGSKLLAALAAVLTHGS